MMCVRRTSMVSYLLTPLCFILLLCGIFSIVWLRSNLISLEYSISELEKNRLDSLREAKMLMAEKSSQLSLLKVEKNSATNLGLVFPSRTKVLYVKEKSARPYSAAYEAQRHGSQDMSGFSEGEGRSGGAL
jgi:hypothetical protein